MRRKKALTALVLALALFGAFTLVSYAANGLQEINAYLNANITFKLDGEEQILKDASGARTYPITYNGTTYVPIRAVANLLDINVDWDQATQTILMGAPEDGVDLFDTYKPYTKTGITRDKWQFAQSTDKQTANAGGVEISHWVGFWFEPFGGHAKTVSFNLGGKYTTLTCQMYSEKDATISVKGDNDSVLGEFDLVGGQVPKTVTINLLNTTQLSFVCDELPDYGECYIFDAKLS